MNGNFQISPYPVKSVGNTSASSSTSHSLFSASPYSDTINQLIKLIGNSKEVIEVMHPDAVDFYIPVFTALANATRTTGQIPELVAADVEKFGTIKVSQIVMKPGGETLTLSAQIGAMKIKGPLNINGITSVKQFQSSCREVLKHLEDKKEEASQSKNSFLNLFMLATDDHKARIAAMNPQEVDTHIPMLTWLTDTTPTAGKNSQLHLVVADVGDVGTFQITQTDTANGLKKMNLVVPSKVLGIKHALEIEGQLTIQDLQTGWGQALKLLMQKNATKYVGSIVKLMELIDNPIGIITAMPPEEIDPYIAMLTLLTKTEPKKDKNSSPQLVVPNVGDAGTFKITKTQNKKLDLLVTSEGKIKFAWEIKNRSIQDVQDAWGLALQMLINKKG